MQFKEIWFVPFHDYEIKKLHKDFITRYDIIAYFGFYIEKIILRAGKSRHVTEEIHSCKNTCEISNKISFYAVNLILMLKFYGKILVNQDFI